MWAHRIAVRIARPLIRPPVRPATGAPTITILMTGAYGGSGVPRAAFGLAEYLDDGEREVEVVNLVRRRKVPVHAFPPGIKVTSLDSAFTPLKRPSRRVARNVLRRFKGRLLHPDDVLAKQTTLWTDVLLIRRLRSIRSGVVITTRPSLNVLAADLARPGVAVIGWDHRDFTRRVPSVRRSIRRSYRKLDALVVLTKADRLRYEDFLGDATPVLAIPNSVPNLLRDRSPLSEPVVIGAGRLTAQK